MRFGILKGSTNTGLDSEVLLDFVAPLNIVSVSPVYSQDMLSLKRKVKTQNVQRWEIETNLLPENNSSDFLIHSLESNYIDYVYVRVPQNTGLNFTTATNITITNTVLKNTNYIDITNASSLVPGEFIKFSGHDKVYIVTESGTGGTGIKVQPSLRQDVYLGESVITGLLVTMKCRYDPTVKLGITYIDGILSDPGSIKLIEML